MEDIYKNFEIKEYLLNYEPNSWKKIVEQLALLGIKYLKSKPPKTNGYTLQELINLNNIDQTKKVTVEAKKNVNIKQTKNKKTTEVGNAATAIVLKYVQIAINYYLGSR